jgi:hypothetical protein
LIWRFEVDRRVDGKGRVDGIQNRGCGRSGRLRQSISGFGWSSSARLIARNSLCRPITAASLRSTPTPEATGGCSGRARATRTNATLISERRPI